MRKILGLIALIGFVAFLGKGWHWTRDGFQILRLRNAGPGTMEEASLTEEVERALEQPFFYLGRGRQCYAFASSDGKYVLKLLRLDRYELPFWMRACRVSTVELKKDKEFRRRFILESCQIAYEELQKETALLYLHLYRTSHLNQPVVIRDRMGRKYSLDLNRFSFVLQEKKPLMSSAFERALREKRRNEALKILQGFLEIVAVRAKKGIFDKDPHFLSNFGWDGEKGVQIDIGSFYKRKGGDPHQMFEISFRETVAPAQEWLKEIDPHIQRWFSLQIEEMIQKFKDV